MNIKITDKKIIRFIQIFLLKFCHLFKIIMIVIIGVNNDYDCFNEK